MSIKQKIKIKTFTGSGSIDFEKDQEDIMNRTTNIQSLADQVQMLENVQKRIAMSEDNLKDLKKEQDRLRNNGLGDIIKNEISVSFGRGEDNKAAHYAELAKGQGLDPTQKLKVEPMTLKALVRERIEAGKEMPTELFGVFSENKTTIKRNK